MLECVNDLQNVRQLAINKMFRKNLVKYVNHAVEADLSK